MSVQQYFTYSMVVSFLSRGHWNIWVADCLMPREQLSARTS